MDQDIKAVHGEEEKVPELIAKMGDAMKAAGLAKT